MKKINFLLQLFVIASTILIVKPAIAAQASTQTNILALVNAYRAKESLPPLVNNSEIASAAEQHSREMAEKKIPFGHDGFSQRMHGLFKEIAGANGGAENVLYADVDDAKTVVRAWLNSSGHRKNIAGRFNLTGIGIAHDKNGRVYLTEIFVRNSGRPARLHPVIF